MAAAICVPQFTFAFAYLILGLPEAELPANILTIVFYTYALVRVLAYVMRGPVVTSDRIFGALSVYLLIGVIWGTGYALLEIIRPDSFVVDAVHNPDSILDFKEFVYFSFVTLTTVGYGEITPVGPQARSLAILEAIGGQFYLAVLIARLVSLYQPETSKGHSERADREVGTGR